MNTHLVLETEHRFRIGTGHHLQDPGVAQARTTLAEPGLIDVAVQGVDILETTAAGRFTTFRTGLGLGDPNRSEDDECAEN